jgi:RNA polymerase sigma-70 factor (ECF subfamily)
MLATDRRAITRMNESLEVTGQPAATAAPSGAQDLELVRLALGARPLAQARLIERMMCVPSILNALNARMGWPLSEDELADAAQNTATLVWRKLSTFNGTSLLETWFYGIARFEVLNTLRQKRLRTTDEIVDETPSARDAGSEVDVERIRAALDRLEAEQAQIVRLHHFDELTLEQCAARLGISLSSAKRRYYRAVERLHAYLAGAYAGETS